MSIFQSIGRMTLNAGAAIWDVFELFFNTLYWLFFAPFRGKFIGRRYIFAQMVFAGVQSLLIVFFVALFIGMVLAMQGAYQLNQLGAVKFVAALISVSMCREIGPILIALVVAGRVGSAIAAELGTMKVTEQIEALETMALNPIRFLVVPRFLALIVMLPALTIMGDLIGMIGGYIVGVYNLKINPGLYIKTNFEFLVMKDVMTGLLKSVVFGMIIALIGCYEGLNTKGGAEGVGRSTTMSVVISFILIILADAVLTGIFYFSNV
ncbi:MAG: ABC transporter permease [Candidatus Omnitrophota bacterium]